MRDITSEIKAAHVLARREGNFSLTVRAGAFSNQVRHYHASAVTLKPDAPGGIFVAFYRDNCPIMAQGEYRTYLDLLVNVTEDN